MLISTFSPLKNDSQNWIHFPRQGSLKREDISICCFHIFITLPRFSLSASILSLHLCSTFIAPYSLATYRTCSAWRPATFSLQPSLWHSGSLASWSQTLLPHWTHADHCEGNPLPLNCRMTAIFKKGQDFPGMNPALLWLPYAQASWTLKEQAPITLAINVVSGRNWDL